MDFSLFLTEFSQTWIVFRYFALIAEFYPVLKFATNPQFRYQFAEVYRLNMTARTEHEKMMPQQKSRSSILAITALCTSVCSKQIRFSELLSSIPTDVVAV